MKEAGPDGIGVPKLNGFHKQVPGRVFLKPHNFSHNNSSVFRSNQNPLAKKIKL